MVPGRCIQAYRAIGALFCERLAHRFEGLSFFALGPAPHGVVQGDCLTLCRAHPDAGPRVRFVFIEGFCASHPASSGLREREHVRSDVSGSSVFQRFESVCEPGPLCDDCSASAVA